MDWKVKVAACAVLAGLMTPVSFSATTSASGTRTPRVAQRQREQQKRIRKGVQNGSLTRRETRRLEREQAAIQRNKVQARSDGTVTPQERARLTREQNRASRDIYRQKHDGQTR